MIDAMKNSQGEAFVDFLQSTSIYDRGEREVGKGCINSLVSLARDAQWSTTAWSAMWIFTSLKISR